MRLTARQKRLLDPLIHAAGPVAGTFFRSVEFRWMHPDNVLSGAGAAKLGGRFAPLGTRAVYASDTEETVLAEIGYRKSRLAGGALIDLDRYPRVIFRIDVRLRRHIDLRGPAADQELNAIRCGCLNPSDLYVSQLVGAYFMRSGIQGVLFPSVVSTGCNIVVFRDNTRPRDVVLFNRAKLMEQLRLLGSESGR